MNTETNFGHINESSTKPSKKIVSNKVPSEIERWAMGLNENENISCIPVNYDSDEYDSIDDSYLEKMITFEDEEDKNEKRYKESDEERYLKVKAILDKIRNKNKNNRMNGTSNL
jgi:hypothetical protein